MAQAVSVSRRSGVNVLLIIVKLHNDEPTMCEALRRTSNKYNKYAYGKCCLHLSMSIISQINRLPLDFEKLDLQSAVVLYRITIM